MFTYILEICCGKIRYVNAYKRRICKNEKNEKPKDSSYGRDGYADSSCCCFADIRRNDKDTVSSFFGVKIFKRIPLPFPQKIFLSLYITLTAFVKDLL